MIVDHHDLVGVTKPLLGKNADGRRTTAYPHPLFFHTIDNGRLAGLHHQLRAPVDRQFNRLFITQRHHHVACHATFFLAAAG